MGKTENLKRVYNGKVNKGYKKSFSAPASARGSFDNLDRRHMTIGTFVEKGKFTYKYGDRNGEGTEKGIIGIERAKHQIESVPNQHSFAPIASPPPMAPVININFNMNGSPETVNSVLSEVPNIARNVSLAAQNTLRTLQQKMQKRKLNIGVQKEVASVQNRPLILEDEKSDQKFWQDNGEEGGFDEL